MLREYFVGVIGIALLASFLLAITHPKAKGVTKFGTGVLLICTVLLPMVDILSGFDINKSIDGILDGIDYEATDSAIELAFEDAVAEYVADKYGVARECVTARADGFDIGTLRAERIYVTLFGEAVFLDYKRIESDVMTEFTNGGECEVFLSLG